MKTTAHNLTQIDDYRQDWRILPAQLVGRLVGYEQEGKEQDIVKLVRTVQRWPGEGDGWWCPVIPFVQPHKNTYTYRHRWGKLWSQRVGRALLR